jgi:hypothetical protein
MEFAKLNIKAEEINIKLLFATDNEGSIIWQFAAKRENLKSLQ